MGLLLFYQCDVKPRIVEGNPLPTLGRQVCCGLMVLIFGNLLLADDPQESLAEVDFATEVRPILSDRCFVCHGPDVATRATDLRLDDPESTHQLAVVPGNIDESELIRRIDSSDADERMPPADSNLSLTEQERETLRRWVESGAKFDEHWSLVPPFATTPPELSENSPWRHSHNPVDRFIGKRLEELGLSCSPEADRTTLIRRLSLDLIGLPPTAAEIEQFEASTEPDALEQLVDRLLSSPKFGEKWAIDWLDVSRYADTYGYQADVYRETWQWRDWVIEALNKNLPFDQFITWQLAGDLLPDPTEEQILATAFNRLHRQTNEGGSVEEEFRAEYVADRVNTFGAAFLGLTLECARCHDHKYDPIPQREYYQLAAFFNSIDESGLYSHFTSAVPTPALKLATAEQRQKLDELKSAIESKRIELQSLKNGAEQASKDELGNDGESDLQDEIGLDTVHENSLSDRLAASTGDARIGHYRFEEIEENKLINAVNESASGKVLEDPVIAPGVKGNALKFSGENGVSIPEGGQWTRYQPFTIALWIKTPQLFERAVILHRSRAWTDAGSRGYELLIEEGKLSFGLIHFWPGDAIRLVTRQSIPIDQWSHVVVTYDGSSLAAGVRIYLDGQPAETETIRDSLTQAIYGTETKELIVGSRFRDVGFKGGAVDELQLFEAELSQLESQFLYWQDADPETVKENLAGISRHLLHQFEQRHSEQVKQLEEELFGMRRAYSQASDPIPRMMVMQDLETPRPTTILHRGEYDAPGDLVEREVPACLPKLFPPSEGDTQAQLTESDSSSDGKLTARTNTVEDAGRYPNRLDLARWLTRRDHPLTARVAVNRIWQALFGRGLVSTTEDFGFQGSMPSHSLLLDWLASYYMDSGWDTKALIRLLVTSETYRQSSDFSPQLLEQDPENIWLARGPSFRLSAELVRDAALSASGLLVEQMGGPPVKPYQPEGLWEEKSGATYQRDVGEGSRRRSIYTFWKRTSPPPSLMAFDASNREVCVVRRQSTMTPLQTLVLLNDPQYVEAARGLADQVYREFSDSDQRLAAIFRRLTSRVPSDAELSLLKGILGDQLMEFRADPEAADQLLQVGDYRVESENPEERIELAALSAVAGGLMSYDEFLMKR